MGSVSWWCGEMVWRVSNKSLNGLSQHTKYLLMAQNSASKHYGKQSGSESVRSKGQLCWRSLLPSFQQGVGTRLWFCAASQESAGQRAHGRLSPRLHLVPDSFPAALPWSSKLYPKADSWVSKAAESLQSTQMRPEKTWVSLVESACFPCTYLHLVAMREKHHLMIWGPGSYHFLIGAHYLRLIYAHYRILTFLCPGHSSGYYEV